jgi:hypothetical protein
MSSSCGSWNRLSRSLKDVLHIMERIGDTGAGFRSITEAIDTTPPAGRMMMQMVGAFAEFERAMIRERTSAGLAAARGPGRIGGRRKKRDPAERREIAERHLRSQDWRGYGATLQRQRADRVRHRRRAPHRPRLAAGEAAVPIDIDKIDETVLALLHLTLHDRARAWKGHGWEALNRLHRKGMIGDPVGKAKSVVLTDQGLAESERLFRKLFARAPGA